MPYLLTSTAPILPPPPRPKYPVSLQLFLPKYPVSWSLLGLYVRISSSAKGYGQVPLYYGIFLGPYEAGTEQFRLCVCSLDKRSLGF